MKHFKNLFSAKWLLAIAILVLFAACGSDDPEKQAAKDREKIIDYIEKHDLDAHELETGVFYVIEQTGNGNFPTENSTVVLNYTGKLLSGKQFDVGFGSSLNLRGTILGFRYGIPMFNRGSKGLLLIPSGLGYGPNGSFSIPPNAVLIFEVEIIDFN
jgi:FKBP-type peptidyl-prolyl cis-trans isomerase FkpA